HKSGTQQEDDSPVGGSRGPSTRRRTISGSPYEISFGSNFLRCDQTTFRKTSEPAKAFNEAPSEPTPTTELSSGSASVVGFPSEALPAWEES
ncbi:hypothetical protein E4U28_001660, partial [Claviceps purpurea]